MNMFLFHRPASHFPSKQRGAEDFRELGAASAGANEQVWRPASQLHQHLPYWPQRRRWPCHSPTQGHAGARQHTLQVRHARRIIFREPYTVFWKTRIVHSGWEMLKTFITQHLNFIWRYYVTLTLVLLITWSTYFCLYLFCQDKEPPVLSSATSLALPGQTGSSSGDFDPLHLY